MEARARQDTLRWVKRELDETLGQARQSLETYFHEPGDTTPLGFCATHLHQVHGTLEMVELHGAALLAEEMQRATQALLDGEVEQQDHAYEVLIRAILQLPDYLERIQRGQEDIPLALLPLLNDLRVARGAAPLSESALFSPNLEVNLPQLEPANDPIESAQARAQAKLLRHSFQRGLLGWFRSQDVAASLERMSETLDRLVADCGTLAVRRLWWVAHALIEGLSDGNVEPSVAVKQLMGRLDRTIKRIADEGETRIVDDGTADELTKTLLFYIAGAEAQGERMQAVQEAFGLSGLVPDEEKVSAAREGLSAPNQALMGTVTSAIKEDLAKIKDSLDLFMRGATRDVSEFEPMLATLNQVSGTLAMLGMTRAQERVDQQRDTLERLARGELAPDEPGLLELASALLSVESSLDQWVESGETGSDDDAEEGALLSHEYRQLVDAVVREVKTEFARIEQAIGELVEAPENSDALVTVPISFTNIDGGLRMLSLERPRAALAGVESYVRTELVEGQRVPDGETLDALADAINGIAYYLEALAEDRSDRESILDRVEERLALLGEAAAPRDPESIGQWSVDTQTLSVDNAAPEVGDEAPETSQDTDASAAGSDSGEDELAESSDEAGTIEIEAPSAEEAEPEAGPVTSDESVSDEQSAAEADSAPTDSAAQAADQAGAASGDDDDEGLGDEIREIFVEEAEEELGSIREQLPRWLNDPQDEDALVTVRRSFHTLKGSGRLVGEARIGEFAWAFENMLNRVIDGTVSSGQAMRSLLEQAIDTLEAMIGELRGNGSPGSDPETLAERAHAISPGEAPSDDSETEAEEPGLVEESEEPGVSDDAGEPEVSDETQETTSSAGPIDEASDVADGAEAEHTEIAGEVQPPTDETAASMEVEHPASASGADSAVDAGEPAEAEPEASEPQRGSAMDPVLYDIFSRESSGHIDELERFVKECREGDEPCPVTHQLTRALHTLHGSARMAGVSSVAEIAGALEHYAKILIDHEAGLDPAGVDALGDGAGAVRDVLERLPESPEPGRSEYQSLLDRLHELEAALTPASEEASSDQPGATEAQTGLAEGEAGEAEGDEITIEGLPDIPEETGEDTETGASVDAEAESEHDTQAFETTESAAASAGETAPADAQEAATDEVDPELLEVFLEEGSDILDSIEVALDRWGAEGEDLHAVVARLQRELHTLKGGARMAGVSAIGDLSHALESALEAAAGGQIPITESLHRTLQLASDRLPTMLDLARQGRAVPREDQLIKRLEALRRGEEVSSSAIEAPDIPSSESPVVTEAEQSEQGPAEDSPASSAEPAPEDEATEPAPEPEAGSAAGGRRREARPQSELVRVRADLLESLVNFAGEVSIYRSRLDQETGVLRFNLDELRQTVNRLREQLRRLEIETETQIRARHSAEIEGDPNFDPLEMDRYSQVQQLSRALAESVNDLQSLQGLLSNSTRQFETLLLQQSRVNTELQEGLMRTRMLPFSGLAPRLHRIVRQTCDQLGKRADLKLEGAEGEMDRNVMERMISPLEHMLRNAISHGIESPEERERAGKPASGTITIRLSREGGELVLTVFDDGGGIDMQAIRQKARERGLVTDDAGLSDNDVLQFILEAGFSTAEQVTQISGRGVGMDVVNSEIKQLGGSLHIESEAGRGTTFTVRLPFTLAINHALFVQVGDDLYAVTLTSIEGVVRVTQEELERMNREEAPHVEYAGQSYMLQYLGALLGTGGVAPTGEEEGAPKRHPVLLVRAGDQRAAIRADAVMGSREIVVKSVGPQLSTVRGVYGATILGDGRVVLILDMGALVRLGVGKQVIPQFAHEGAEAHVEERKPTVMVVDDSITMRKVAGRLLERNGMEVVTAKDGVDAVGQLQERIPDVMLLDIEMPRMDGYELATHMRNDERLREVPIIMITSRFGQKHRERAEEIGVERYMGKPYQEAELIDNIQAVLSERRGGE